MQLVRASRHVRRTAAAFCAAVLPAAAACWGTPSDARPDPRADSLAPGFPRFGENVREQLARFRRLDVPDRLRVYNYWYDHSGHPREQRLAFGGFEDRPADAFAVVVADLPPGNFDRFMRYLPILVVLSDVRGYDVCRDPHLPTLVERVRSYRLAPEVSRLFTRPPMFARCPLFGPGRPAAGRRSSIAALAG